MEDQGLEVPFWHQGGAPAAVTKMPLNVDLGIEGAEKLHLIYPEHKEDYKVPCFMVVGPQGSGKSAMIRRLGGANTAMQEGPTSRPFGAGMMVSCTINPEIFQTVVNNPAQSKTVIHLIDMPGFNESSLKENRASWLNTIAFLISCYGDQFKGFIAVVSDVSDSDRDDISLIAALCECGMLHGSKAFIPVYTYKGSDTLKADKMSEMHIENLKKKGLQDVAKIFQSPIVTSMKDVFDKDSVQLQKLKEILGNFVIDTKKEMRPCIWQELRWTSRGCAQVGDGMTNFVNAACTKGLKMDVNHWRKVLGGKDPKTKTGPDPGEHIE